MQVMYPPSGLAPYPNAGFGEGMKAVGNTFATFAKVKKQVEDEKAMRQLQLYLQAGETMGELEKPTPEIQKAFKRIYGYAPQTGIFATGGETLAGRRARVEITGIEAETSRKESMSKWYEKKGVALETGKTDTKALDYAVKYANAKLGKPFEVLDEKEREMWQNFHDEGIENYATFTNKHQAPKAYNTQQQGWINRWKALPGDKRKRALGDTTWRQKIESELQQLGLSLDDLD